MAPTKKPRDPFRPYQTAVEAKPHPSRGGRAYPQEIRDIVILDPDALPVIPGWTPSLRSRRRYRQRLNNLGHCRKFKRRGNRRPTAIVGYDKLLLVLFRAAFPKATAAEVAAFLYRNTLNANPVIFSPTQITAAEDSLGSTRKRGSKLTMQAMSTYSIHCRCDDGLTIRF
jgi:hypothetical protein